MHCSRRECVMRKLRFVKGFTMAEMMIVVLIMGVVTLVGLPLLTNSMDHYRLKGAAEEVVNALRYAQSSAVASGLETKVSFRPLQEKITVRQYKITADLVAGGNTLSAVNVESGTYEIMPHPLRKGYDYQIILLNEDRFKGVDIVASAIGHDGEVVQFNTLGIPSGGGTVTLSLGGQQMVVTLDTVGHLVLHLIVAHVRIQLLHPINRQSML